MTTILLLQSQDCSDVQQQSIAPKNWNGTKRCWNILATFLCRCARQARGDKERKCHWWSAKKSNLPLRYGYQIKRTFSFKNPPIYMKVASASASRIGFYNKIHQHQNWHLNTYGKTTYPNVDIWMNPDFPSSNFLSSLSPLGTAVRTQRIQASDLSRLYIILGPNIKNCNLKTMVL